MKRTPIEHEAGHGQAAGEIRFVIDASRRVVLGGPDRHHERQQMLLARVAARAAGAFSQLVSADERCAGSGSANTRCNHASNAADAS